MYCPFLKRTDYYDYSGTRHLEKQNAHIQRENFCECKDSECMAFSRNSFGKPYCKLIEKKN